MASIGELVKHRAGTQTNTIDEFTSGSGVTVDGVLLKDAQVTASGASGIITDTITERTAAAGVTIDGVLLKDGALEEVIRMQFEQATGTPSTPASGESLFYVKNDGIAYLLNSDGVETPVGGGNTIDRITQASHGFSVGNLLYLDGATFKAANATGSTTAEVAGMVYRNLGTNEFEITTGGEVGSVPASGFSEGSIPAAGTVLFLNAATGTGAGLLTVTEPSVVGQISKPAGVVKASGTTATVYFFNMRGTTVGGTNLYTTISLANNATTAFHTIQGEAGTGGWISGTIKIDATTDYVIPFFCFFDRQLDGTTYNVSPQFGDTIPSGLSITNSGSSIQVVMPNNSGFSSASVTYCVQSAANGTTLPVNVPSAQISWSEQVAFRNVVHNGTMAIDQRNAGASKTFTAAAALAYSIDRWYGYCTGANVTGQRVAGTLSPYMYQFTGAASVTKIGFAQRIEASNCWHLAGSSAKLAVDLSNSLLTTVTWTAWYANTSDTFGTLASPTRTQIATGTFTVTSTNTRYYADITIPAAATTGIEIEFSVGAQTSGTWKIGRVQLEPGTIATPFEFRPYGTELALCERYYEVCTGSYAGTGSGGYGGAQVTFRAKKRAAPTVTRLSDNQVNSITGSPYAEQITIEGFRATASLTGGAGSFSTQFSAENEL
jgi:hypothetical protein